MKFTTDETGKRGVLMLDGSLTVRTIEGVKPLLLSSLQSVDELELDLNGVTEVDLCALQLSCSLKRAAMKLNKKVIYPDTPPPVFTKAIEEAGACFHSGCELAGETCFWKRGLG